MRSFPSSAHAQRLARSRHHSESVSRGSAPAEIGSSSNVAGTSFHRVDRSDSSLIFDQLALVWSGLASRTLMFAGVRSRWITPASWAASSV